jgi:hypothetical protein
MALFFGSMNAGLVFGPLGFFAGLLDARVVPVEYATIARPKFEARDRFALSSIDQY